MSNTAWKARLLSSLVASTFSAGLYAATKEKETAEENKAPKAAIELVGTGGELYKNLTLNIPSRVPECTVPKEEITAFLKSLKKRFRKASRAVGYYDTQFTPTIRSIDGCWKVTVKIKANRPVKVSNVLFSVKGEGNRQKEFQELLQTPPYKNGDILNHNKYTNYKTQLKNVSQSLGYFDAAFEEHKITVNPLTFSANVQLVFNTGKRFRYGNIKVQQKVLDNNVIQQFLQIKEGDYYSTEELIKQQQLLQNSGYYADIKIDALHKQAVNQHVPIDIHLTAKKRNAYRFKVGYGTDTGPRISADFDRRWTGSKGRRLNLSATASTKISTFTGRLTQPKSNPKDDTLSYLFAWKQDISDDITSNSLKLGAEYTRKTPKNWQQTASLTHLLETTTIDDEESSRSQLTLLGLKAEKTKSDQLIFPLNGWRLKGEIRGAINNVLSDQNVLQFEGNGKLITKFGAGRLVSRLDLGYTLVGKLDDLPKSLRFFAGGGQSVRGYSFESLGESNDDGTIIGGKNLLVGSVEYEHPINDQWSAAVFTDAGNAFNDWSSQNLKLGMGFGARWKSPVGPVRIDIGFPKDQLADPRLHLSIGADL